MQLASVLLILMCDVQSSLADMVMLPPFRLDDSVNLIGMAANFGFTTIIEYLAIYHILGRPKKAKTGLFLFVFLVNLITNPAAQIGVWFIGEWFVIEAVVILVEFGLLMLVFARMFRIGALSQPIGAGRTLVVAVMANIASFGLGIVGFFVLASLKPVSIHNFNKILRALFGTSI